MSSDLCPIAFPPRRVWIHRRALKLMLAGVGLEELEPHDVLSQPPRTEWRLDYFEFDLNPIPTWTNKGELMEQKPTIGRIVHVANEQGATCAAIVTAVLSDTKINAARYNPDGTSEPALGLEKVSIPPKGVKDWNWPARA